MLLYLITVRRIGGKFYRSGKRVVSARKTRNSERNADVLLLLLFLTMFYVVPHRTCDDAIKVWHAGGVKEVRTRACTRTRETRERKNRPSCRPRDQYPATRGRLISTIRYGMQTADTFGSIRSEWLCS